MEVVATRKKEKDISYVMVRNIILGVIGIFLGTYGILHNKTFYWPVFIIASMCYVLGILVIVFGIKDFLFKKRINKLPEEAIYKHYKKLIICNEKESTINFKDIQEIKSRRYIKTSFGLAQYLSKEGVLKIKTSEKVYKVENVRDVKEIHNLLNDWTNLED